MRFSVWCERLKRLVTLPSFYTEMSSISARAIDIWANFPPNVRNDHCFKSFRAQYDIETATPNHTLLGSKKYSALQTARFNWKNFLHGIFFILWLISFWYYVTVPEHSPQLGTLSIDSGAAKFLYYKLSNSSEKCKIILTGPFTLAVNRTTVGEWITVDIKVGHQILSTWNIGVDRNISEYSSISTTVINKPSEANGMDNLTVAVHSSSQNRIQIQVSIELIENVFSGNGVIYAACLLIFLNVLIISEVVHRTLAALFTAFLSIATLAALNDRPTMHDVVNWIDSEALLLMFSMMTIVSVLMETGIFGYIAVYTFKISKGSILKLITILCIVSAAISMFLDNVVTILLLTPITVKLFECLNLNPVPVLPFIILNVNIAGLTTLIGHPPNLLITGDRYVAQQNVTFLTYAMHMSVGVVISLVATNIYLRIQGRNIETELKLKTESEAAATLKVWHQCADQITSIQNGPLGEDIRYLQISVCEKITSLERIGPKLSFGGETFAASLAELKATYPIKNKSLLIKAAFVTMLIISLFFIESIPSIQRLSLGWCAFTGVALLLVIADCDLEEIVLRIEWTALLFFGSMFISMECLARLGLIKYVGKQTENLIFLVDREYQLALAIILVLSVSALASSVIDSVPVTAMMVKIVVSLAENTTLKLPIQPLIWALAYGPTLGGNCSLYGASSNIVCATVAEKLGHKITFFQYLKIGFPVMVINVTLVAAYLLIAHTYFEWHPVKH